MTEPTPAIVAQHAVRRLPRVALWLFCLAYVLPGLLGRNPWKVEEIAAFGHMLNLFEGHSDWLNPRLWGQAPELDALLPYWLGAWAIAIKPAWMAADLASRIPYALLSLLTLVCTWHGAYYSALSPQAQPVAFAFGGEAHPKDYARAMADGSVLALIACLGLALPSHEAGPILAQLAFVACAFYGIATLPYHPSCGLAGVSLGILGLSLSGAPSFAVLMACGSGLLCLLDRKSTNGPTARWHALGLVLIGAVAALLATQLDVWQWRLQMPQPSWPEWRDLLNLLAWFTWPAWPLALWTLWRWRRHWVSLNWSRHLVLPLWFAALTIGTTLFTPAPQRTLLLSLPAMATLAAFALPTMRRSMAALIDWFTLLFFSGCAFIIWVVWLAMQTGWPPQPAENVARLAPGFVPSFGGAAFWAALAATAVWGWLVHWRIGRHRHPLWKSMVLPAGGAALCWLLLMTLWLPLLDYARSYAPWAQQIQAIMTEHGGTRSSCVMSYGLNLGQMTGFHYHGQLDVISLDDAKRPQKASCDWLLVDTARRPDLALVVRAQEWQRIQTVRRPADRREDVTLYRRTRP